MVKNGEDFLVLVVWLEVDSGIFVWWFFVGNCISYYLLDKGIWLQGLNYLCIGGLYEFGIEYVDMKYLNEFYYFVKLVDKVCFDMYILEVEIIELNSKLIVLVGELGVDVFL